MKMKSIIKSIYKGEIYLREDWCYYNPEYKKNFHKVVKLKDKFRKRLDDKDFERLDHLTLAYATCEDIAAREKFTEGFKLGMRIAIEIYFEDKPKLFEKYLSAKKDQN